MHQQPGKRFSYMADEGVVTIFDGGDLSNFRCETNIASARLNAPEVLPTTTPAHDNSSPHRLHMSSL